MQLGAITRIVCYRTHLGTVKFSSEVLEREASLSKDKQDPHYKKPQPREDTPYDRKRAGAIEEESPWQDSANNNSGRSQILAESVPKLVFPSFGNKIVEESSSRTDQKGIIPEETSGQNSIQARIDENSNLSLSQSQNTSGFFTKKPLKSALKKKNSFEVSTINKEEGLTHQKKLRITDEPPEVIPPLTPHTTLSEYAEHITSVVDSRRKSSLHSAVGFGELS